MKIAPLADVKARLSAYLDECESEGPVVITRNGKAAAILLAPRDEEDLERLVLVHSRRFQSLLAKSRRSIKAGKGVSQNEFWKTVAQRHRAKDVSRLRKQKGSKGSMENRSKVQSFKVQRSKKTTV